MATRPQRAYDHRLVRLVQETGDPEVAAGLGVPRPTVAGWLRRGTRRVVTDSVDDEAVVSLRRQVALLEKRTQRVRAALRVLFVVHRVLKPDLTRLRLSAGDKERLLRAVDRTRGAIGLRRVLALFGLAASRLHAWRVAAATCRLEDQSSCPKTSPQRLTPQEIARLRALTTSDDLRHVPTGRLALLAQRTGAVVVSPSTPYRLVRERGWRRPRTRVHPEAPREGMRATRPDKVWHVDTTLIRLLDGSKAYVHAVIDNFSRRILAWRVADRFDPGNCVDVLVRAAAGRDLPQGVPTLLADSGVENVNADVDALVASGVLKRLLAQTEVRCSNSMIEAFWRCLKQSVAVPQHPRHGLPSPKPRRLLRPPAQRRHPTLRTPRPDSRRDVLPHRRRRPRAAHGR